MGFRPAARRGIGRQHRRQPPPWRRRAAATSTAATAPAEGATAARLPRLLARYALGLATLTAAALYAPLVAVAAPLAGLCLGPSLATLFGLASSAAPDGAAPRRSPG